MSQGGEGEKKHISLDACLQSSHIAHCHTPAGAYRSGKNYISVGHKFEAKMIKGRLNMREMLETSHLSAVMGSSEPPPTAPTRELVNALHMWDPLMQFRVSPKA